MAAATKTNEISLWKTFLASLPEGGYLESMFKSSAGMIERMIQSDFAYDPIAEIEAQKLSLRGEIAQLQDQVKTLHAEAERQIELARSAERRTRVAKEEIQEMKRIAGRIAAA